MFATETGRKLAISPGSPGSRDRHFDFSYNDGKFPSEVYHEGAMAKKKTEAPPPTESANTEPAKDESVAGYFKRIFAEDPKLLKERSNEKLLERWLADHPGHTEVPQSVKNN